MKFMKLTALCMVSAYTLRSAVFSVSLRLVHSMKNSALCETTTLFKKSNSVAEVSKTYAVQSTF